MLFLLLVALLPRTGATEPFNGRNLDQRMVEQVMAAAFDIIAPRSLTPIPIPRLALWAMNGLAALDPQLQPELRDGTLRLAIPGRVLFARLPPAPDDAEGWGEAIGQMVRAAWDASSSVRDAGTQAVVAALMDELTSHLDPYSRYAPPAEADAELERRDGAGGIGATLALWHGQVVVDTIRPHGPAAIAGLRPGDAVLSIDNVPTDGEELSTLRGLLAGPEQSSVRLTLRRDAAPERTVEIVRALIVPPTVIGQRHGDILVLRVTGFAADTSSELAQVLADVAGSRFRPRGVVIDLRGNRGGLLREAAAAAEVFLPYGVIATTDGRDADATETFTAHGADLTAGLPIVVLVDGATASSAEVLAAALADQHRAVVVGSGTFGKGLVQSAAPLPDGGLLYVSWSWVLAPMGWPIQGLGVLPQICTSFGQPAAVRQLRDLDAGSNDMAEALGRHHAARTPLTPAAVLMIRAACPAAQAVAGGRDPDWPTVEWLVHDRRAYGAALIGPPPAAQALPNQPISNASR